jgi:beta-lactamase regulating signal transducer with metallopeptidase domain
MSLSLILTNCLFCGLAAIFLLPSLSHPKMLSYKNGLPLFIVVIFTFIRLLFPYEFFFTTTLASKHLLPLLKKIENIHLFKDITLGNIFIGVWLLFAFLIIIYVLYKHQKLMRILSLVPETSNREIQILFSVLCVQKKIKNIPKLIQLDSGTSPFIVGYKKPIIMLPLNLTETEAKCILLHELEHLKHHHVLIRTCIEMVTIIYWWNPVIWVLRKAVIRSLELQADANAIKDLSPQAQLGFLETLISISKNVYESQNSNLALSFALKNSMIEYRVQTILSSKYNHKNTKSHAFHFSLLVFSLVFLLFSFVYTFESYNVNPIKTEGTFTLDTQTDYFIFRGENCYDLYLDGKFALTMESIPDDLSNLPIHK